MADGRYISLDELKLYGIGAVADPNNPTIYNRAVQGTPDDSVLEQCIFRAETEWDRLCGCAFDEQTRTTVQAFIPFVDGNGWLHLFARENIPVTDVESVELRDLKGANVWTSLAFVSDNVILPPNTGTPRPDSAHVFVIPSAALSARATGQVLARWTYTGGYGTIPSSLKSIISRLAWYIYKLREAPMYQVMMPSLGIMQIPISLPKDIMVDVDLWKPSYA